MAFRYEKIENICGTYRLHMKFIVRGPINHLKSIGIGSSHWHDGIESRTMAGIILGTRSFAICVNYESKRMSLWKRVEIRQMAVQWFAEGSTYEAGLRNLDQRNTLKTTTS